MRNAIRGCAIATLIMGAGTVSAGGLWLNDYGDSSGGRAGAGAASGIDEAMTLAYNPASITRLKGNQVFASAGAIAPKNKFDPSYTTQRLGTDNGGDAGVLTPVASAAYIHDFDSERWSAGIGLVPLAGAGLDYDDDWVGRYQTTDVELTMLALAPTLAYRVTDELSIGVTVQAYYTDLEIKTAVPRLIGDRADGRAKIDGDDTGVGFTLGAMYELSERTRFGLFYQSELEPGYDGDIKTNPAGLQVNTDLDINFAEYVRFAVHQDMNERWGVDFTIGWDNWSALGNIPVNTENRGVALPAKWGDTHHFAWGTQYKLDKYWTLTGGVAYDGNPVGAQARSVILPADKTYRYAVGASYALSDTLTVGGYASYWDLGKAQIESARFGGDFDGTNNAVQLMANLNWTF